MAEMTTNTRTTLIDGVEEALKSRELKKIYAIQDLLKIKCHQSSIPWLTFLVDEVLPYMDKRSTISIKKQCPYCERGEFSNETALKAHLGRKHQDKKSEWSQKI
jgi:hypothetical protein